MGSRTGLPCRTCAYRDTIPGDEHSRCVFDWKQDVAGLAEKFADVSDRVARWFTFPFNFDPIWGLATCSQRSGVRNPEKVAPPNPFGDIVSLLGGRR